MLSLLARECIASREVSDYGIYDIWIFAQQYT